jgi:hypothetical protein
MNLLPEEKILMEGDNKQITLTTHRIRQENKSWGKIDLTSIMLEHVTSCEYIKKSQPLFLILGILLAALGLLFGNEKEELGIGLLFFSFMLFIIYFFTIKRGLFISSASAKVILNTKGMKDDNIKSFIDKLEAAKNDRFHTVK